MPYRNRGGGGGGVHAVIAQESDSAKGIEIAVPYDATWRLDGVQRTIGERAKLFLPAARGSGSNVTVTAPEAFTDGDLNYEQANQWPLIMRQGITPVEAVAAVDAVPAQAAVPATARLYWGSADNADYIEAGRLLAGEDGNDWHLTFETHAGDLNAGLQISTDNSNNEFQVLISTTNVPTVRAVREAMSTFSVALFTAVFRGAEPDAATLMTTDLATALPNGVVDGVRRLEDFTGGADETFSLPLVVAIHASVRLYWAGLGPLNYFDIFRNPAGAGGNAWDIRISTTDDVLTDGFAIAQVGATGNQRIELRIQNTNRPLITAIIADFLGRNAFDAVLPDGITAEGTQLPTNLNTILPNGADIAATATVGAYRAEDFAGGANFVAAVPGVPAVAAVAAVAGTPVEFHAAHSSGDVQNDNWILDFNALSTLDEIADVIRGADFLNYFNRQAADAPLHIFPDEDVVIVGNGDDLLAPTYITGENTQHDFLELFGAVNSIPAEVIVDRENSLITVSYDVSDPAALVLDLFTAPAEAVLVYGTEDDAILEAPPFERVFRGIAGSGVGYSTRTTLVTRITYEEEVVEAIDFTEANVAVDTGLLVPAGTKTFHINYGSSSDGVSSGIDLLWFAIPIEEWERLEGVDVGDAPTQANARFTRTWRDSNITATGNVAARQVWIGRGNNGNIFVFSDNVIYDIYPLRVRFEIQELVPVLEVGDSALAVQRSNARAYFWLKGQDEQSPKGDIFPAELPVTATGIAIVEFQSENPNLAYDNGDIIYAGITRLSGGARRSVRLPRGRHDLHIVMESNYAMMDAMLVFSLFRDTSVGNNMDPDDRYLGQGTVSDLVPMQGMTLAARFLVPDVIAGGAEDFYIRIDGLAPGVPVNFRGFVSFEFRGAE